MPLALLLEEVFGPLLNRDKGIFRLGPLGPLALIDELLLERVRSAFVVRWFGRGLPFERLGLRMHVDNIEPLRRRYQAIAAQLERGRDVRGVNLTEPLAGLAGAAAGTLLSPTGILAMWIQQFRSMNRLGTTLVGIVFGPLLLLLAFWISLLAGAGGVVALGLGIYVGLDAVLRDDPALRSSYDFLGALARFIDPFADFVGQLLGPRSKVKNPLLRHILQVADRFAAALSLALGFLAVVGARVLPALLPLAFQIGPLLRFVQSAGDLLAYIFADVSASFEQLLLGESSPFMAVAHAFQVLPKLLRHPVQGLGQVFDGIRSHFAQFGKEAKARLASFGKLWRSGLETRFQSHSLFRIFRAIQTLAAVKLPAPTPVSWSRPPPEEPGVISRIGQSVIDALLARPRQLWKQGPAAVLDAWRKAGSPVPRVVLPRVDDLVRRLPEPAFRLWRPSEWQALFEPFPTLAHGTQRPTAEWSKAAVAAASRRPKAFRVPPLDIEAYRAREQSAREHWISVIERVLPPQVRQHVPALLGVFRQLDDELYASDAERKAAARQPEKRAFPVLELDDRRGLFPLVRKLRVRVRGGYEPELRSFRDKLTGALGARQYVVS